MSTADEQAKLTRQTRLHLVFALISAGFTILAVAIPVWFEEITGLEPDGGGGEFEWLLAVVFYLVGIGFGVLCYQTRRQRSGAFGQTPTG